MQRLAPRTLCTTSPRVAPRYWFKIFARKIFARARGLRRFFPVFLQVLRFVVPATVRSARSGLPIPTLTPAARAAQNTRAHVPLVLLAGAEHPLVRIIELDPKTRVAAQSASGEGGRRARRSARAHCRAARACKAARAGQETAPAQRGALGSRLHAGAPHLSHSLLLASPLPHQAQRAHRAVAITSST